MDLYLDSADMKQVERFCRLGSFRGVTTNPIILGKAGLKAEEAGPRLLKAQDGVVFLQAMGPDPGAMIKHGLALAHLDMERVRIKVPAVRACIEAMKALSDHGVHVAATAVFTLGQALFALAAGARTIIPFYGRLEASGGDPDALLHDLVGLAFDMESQPEILVASAKTEAHVAAAVRSGANGVTLPPSLADALLQSPLADKAVSDFDEAAGRVASKNLDE